MTVTTKWVSLGVVAAATVYGAWALLRPESVRVETAPAARRPLQVTVDEEGETRVRDRFVLAAPVAGRVARIALREGDSVRVGTVVARVFPAPLDPRSRREAVARLEAADDAQRASIATVAQARAALNQAQRERQRAQSLVAENAIATETRERTELAEELRARDLESAEFRAQAAAHEVEVARAAVATGGAPITIRSPVAGRVLRVPEPSERVVAAGTPLVEVGDRSRLEVVADLLSADAVQVPREAPILIEGWGGETLHGRVRLVEPSAFTKVSALGVEEQRVNVIGDLLDQPPTLGDRYRVEIRIVIWSADSVLTVPASALFRAGEGWQVFVVEQGRARSREVTIGHRTSLDVEITGGVREGEIVIRYPSDRVSDGARVAAPATDAR
ncbi:MAG TPA: efflux RND transporter periplasmic adaptor subunit [Gemmatimonadales bacterium]|nr:efflux RND transporter periplasmic adaptor subunit [Gemmatimonadales bacterium]